jgi:type I restriction enzyme, R subunit
MSERFVGDGRPRLTGRKDRPARHHRRRTPDPVLVAFRAVIDRLNDLFGADFSRSQVEGFVDTLGAVLLEVESLIDQALANSCDQFLESPDLGDAVVDAIFATQESHNVIADYTASGHADSGKIIDALGAMIHAAAQVDRTRTSDAMH